MDGQDVSGWPKYLMLTG